MPGIRNELVEVDPSLPSGVSVQVVISAADQLVAANPTDEVLEIPGADGEPFLRIGPDGVLANFRSPTWHRTLNPDQGGALPPEADADAPLRPAPLRPGLDRAAASGRRWRHRGHGVRTPSSEVAERPRQQEVPGTALGCGRCSPSPQVSESDVTSGAVRRCELARRG